MMMFNQILLFVVAIALVKCNGATPPLQDGKQAHDSGDVGVDSAIGTPDESLMRPSGPTEVISGSDAEENDELDRIVPDSCTEALQTVCNLGASYTFEQSIRCLESHMSELQGACSVALNVMMANLYADCGDAVSTLCPVTVDGDESIYVLTCLSNHESELSADCQQQLDSYLNDEYPCAKEATEFCSQDLTSPESALECLESVASSSPEQISSQCFTILDGFSSCKEQDEPGSEGKPRPKPKPRARSRMLSTPNAMSKSNQEEKPKPKPKPNPREGEQKEICWRGQGQVQGKEQRSNDGAGFLGGLGSNDFSTTSSASDSENHSVGVVVSSMAVALALVGAVGLKYRQSQREVDSRGGYWRAPSIQAMLFDDSAHPYNGGDNNSFGRIDSGCEEDGGSNPMAMGRVVDMDHFKKGGMASGPTVEAVEVTLSPIGDSDEIRV